MASTAHLCLSFWPAKPVKSQCQVCFQLESEFNLSYSIWKMTQSAILENIHSHPKHSVSGSQWFKSQNLFCILISLSYCEQYWLIFCHAPLSTNCENKEILNFVVWNCAKTDRGWHSKAAKMIGLNWFAFPGAWGEQEVASAVPPENAVTDSVHGSGSWDFSN